jgi:hypothetical protein
MYRSMNCCNTPQHLSLSLEDIEIWCIVLAALWGVHSPRGSSYESSRQFPAEKAAESAGAATLGLRR